VLGRDHAGLDDDSIEWIMAGAKAKAERPINDRADEEPPPPNGPADYYSNGNPDKLEAHKKRLLQSSREFTASYVPLDYLVDGLILEAFLYSLTGATGAGKTAISLRLAASVGLGILFANRTTKKRRVLYLAAENPVDIRMRWIALAQQMDFDPDTIEVYFVEGAFKISQTAARLKAEAAQLGGEFGLVIVDTSPVFYEGDDENNRNQQGKHAELLRSLIDIIPGRPAVIANCHPIKNAPPDNLLQAAETF
jgi:RecA-family ATPase